MQRHVWGRRSVWAGLVLMVVCLLDPLEGSVGILAGTALVALGAWLVRAPRPAFAWAGFALTAIGVAALFILSAFGGVGGTSGHSWWWAVTLLPYPAGWVVSLIGARRALRAAPPPPPAAGSASGGGTS